MLGLMQTNYVSSYGYSGRNWHVSFFSSLLDMRDWNCLIKNFIASNDKKGVNLINTAFGALVVQTLRSLDSNSLLSAHSYIPDLEIGLERFTRWGTFAEKRLGLKSPYLTVIKGYGKKLFGDRNEKERIHMRASRASAYKHFLQELDKSEKERRKLPNGKYFFDDGDEVVDPWKGASTKDTSPDHHHADFDAEKTFTRFSE